MPGPVPKRTAERRRVNKPEIEVSEAPGAAVVEIPEPDKYWHDLAQDWYLSLAQSGQSAFYEPSDWMVARYIAEAMSRNLLEGRFSAMLFASVLSGMSSLLVTEGDRRRLRIELQRASTVDADEEAANATVMALQSRLTG